MIRVITTVVRVLCLLWLLCLLPNPVLLCADSKALHTPSVKIPQIRRPPTLDQFIQMQTVDDIPVELERVEGLAQRTPTDGAPVSERTVVYLGYDEKNVYAVFVCFDRTPNKIRARMASRDRFPDDDDSVSLHLDTFRDRKHAYGFQVNPLGVQIDGIFTEGKGWDLSYDTVWFSEGRLTSHGYVVMITVPFKSLRFPPGMIQSWRISVHRGIPRNNENAYWPPYSARFEGRLNQQADLQGLENISPGRGVQFVPYASFLSSRTIEMRDPTIPRFSGKSGQLSAGLDSKFIIKKSLVLDTTANPDFSQVESDEPQETVNQRFEVFFPEKRPFFIENASYFDTPINLLFTRRIADPQFGARLTGKLGRYAIGALIVDDRSSGEIVPQGDPLAGRRALFAVLRINRDLGRHSSIGLVYSERTFHGSSNLVAGLDGRIKLNQNWVATFQAVASSTSLPGEVHLAGPAYEGSLLRSGHKFSYQLQFDDRSPGFRAESGFINRVDIQQVDQMLSYRFRPKGQRLISWGPDLVASNIWDHRNARLDEAYTPKISLEFSRQTGLTVFHTFRRERLRNRDFRALAQDTDFGEGESGLSLNTSFIPPIALSAQFTTGKGINFLPPASSAPFSVDKNTATVMVSIRPTRSLTMDNSYLLTRLVDAKSARAVLNDHILRSKWNYQFTRALSLRMILQYNGRLVNQALTSLQTTKRMNADVLLTYLPHPGTALFVGYTTNLENVDPRLISTTAGLRRTGSGFINDGRQFFMKLSYLFRF